MRFSSLFSMKTLAVFGVALALFHALWFIGVTYLTRFQLPAWDLWEFLRWWADRESVWRAIYEQYEHHRLVVLGSLVYLDQVYLGGRYLSVYLVTIGATVAFSIWALVHLRRSVDDGQSFPFVVAALATGVFCLTNVEGYMHGFRAWVPLTLLLSALTMACFARVVMAEKVDERRSYLVLTLVLAIVDNYTGASGMLIWPALGVMAVMMRAGWRVFGVLLVVGAATITVFLYGFAYFEQGDGGFVGATKAGGFANFLYPGRLFLSLIQFIGAPMSQSFFIHPFSLISLEFGMALGFLALVGVAWYGLRALVRPPETAVEITILGYLVFTMGWTVTASVKHHPLPPEPWQPIFKSQDFIVALTMVSALFAGIYMWMGSRRLPKTRVLFGLFAVGAAVLFVPLQLQMWPTSVRMSQEARLGGLGFASNVWEDGYTTHGFWHSKWIRANNGPKITGFERSPGVHGILMRLGIPPLDHPAPRAVGRPFAEAFGASPVATPCDGEIVGRHLVLEGVRLWGRLAPPDGTRDVRLIFVDEAGVAVGVAEPFDRFKVRMPLEMPGYPADGGWIGYARVGEAEPLTAVAVDGDGRQVCRLKVP